METSTRSRANDAMVSGVQGSGLHDGNGPDHQPASSCRGSRTWLDAFNSGVLTTESLPPPAERGKPLEANKRFGKSLNTIMRRDGLMNIEDLLNDDMGGARRLG